MKREKQFPQQMIDEAKELYLQNNGRRFPEIEREMQRRGWPFYRQMFYTRRHSHGVTQGWPVQFGWDKLLKKKPEPRKQQRNRDRHLFERWLNANFPEWCWAWRYQRYIYERLADVTSGKCKRLMIFMPPRHGKSELVTVRYTAWRILQDPKLNVILGSYNQRLADKFSRKIKRIVRSADTPVRMSVASTRTEDAAQDLTGGTGDADKSVRTPMDRLLSSAAEWETSGGGVIRSVGVGGGIAGFGAGLIVIDDPVKSRAESESETYRERVWDWFNDDIYTRTEPNAAIVLIQTRWHEDDLAGRLLKESENGGEKWTVVRLPALAETGTASIPACPDASKMLASPVDPLGRKPGQALCPQRYNVKALERFRKKLGSYSFAALYQQSPAPAEGGRFKRAWFTNIVEHAPKGLRWKRGYDLAVSIKTSADYTASFRCAKDAEGNLYIDGGFRKRIEYPDQRRYIIERMRAEPDTEHGIEAAMHGQAVVQDLRRDADLGRFAFRQVNVRGDKLTRALAWLNLAEEGKLRLVRGPWIDGFVDEVCRFPHGRHDDQIDAISIAVEMLSVKRPSLVSFR
ncbi:MAG: phage terminase large subunit [Blastocatellia bacterium]|nr:phage terminase large subunit [Blastocatellia bacterium]